jgi:catechol 2,3-dioxygenase-like lactoylglutathione lyase family enzyme
MGDRGVRQLVAFAAVFTVADVAASVAHYVERLGFRVQFRLGDPPSYAIIERDALSLHLMPARESPGTLGRSSVYVFVADVDALHDELRGRGGPIEVAPADFDYGMREFSVRDPDGNRLTFGREVAKAG